MSRRLAVVQRRLRQALDRTPSGPVRLVSMCAGQGRDVLGVLVDHQRRPDVTARLVELAPELVADARAAVDGAGLHNVEVVEGDAEWTGSYAGAVPAHIMIACGVLGNIGGDDIRTTILELPHLCAESATVILTRHQRAPGPNPDHPPLARRGRLRRAGVRHREPVRLRGRHPSPCSLAGFFRPGRRLFNFAGDGSDAHH